MSALSGRTILVVDDEELLREVLVEEFGAHGAKVVTAANAVEALDRLREQSFDAVFADLKMPGGDGLTLLEKASKLDRTPLLFLCSGLTDISVKEVRRLGIAAIIKKPFDCAAMIRTVSEAFGQS